MPAIRLAVALAGLAALLVGCRPLADDDDDMPAKREKKVASSDRVVLSAESAERAGLRTEEAALRVLTPSFRAPARVVYNEESTAHVGSPVAGRAIQIMAKVGDLAKKGDELLVVESRELGEAQSDFLQKRAVVAIARDAVEIPKTALERAQSLSGGGGVSLAEVQKRQAEYRAALANLQNAEVALTNANQKLRLLGMDDASVAELEANGRLSPRYVVRAPISGTVIQREVTLGEPVVPEKETLLILTDLSTLWVIADVPEAKLRQVAQGARVLIRTTLASDRPLEGTVALVSPALNPSTRTVPVRIEMRGGASMLAPGMFAEAEIFETAAEKTKPTLAIPAAAIQRIDGATVVFVPDPNEPNAFVKRPVRRGREVGEMAEILDGLRPGEKVVTAGSLILKGELANPADSDDPE